jgi:hypothetical protein
MDLERSLGSSSWLPFTFRGGAACARAPLFRVVTVALVMAALTASASIWIVTVTWAPVVERAIHALPEQGQIRNGRIEWTGDASRILADSRVATVVVDLGNAARVSDSGDVLIRLHRESLTVCSWFGCVTARYPTGWIIALNRADLEPWWGAWRLVLGAGLGMAVAVGLLAAEFALAFLLAGPARLAALWSGRETGLWGCWKLVMAACQPGTVVLLLGLLAYGLAGLGVASLAAAVVAQLLVVLIYLPAAITRLPRVDPGTTRPENPFAAGPPPGAPPPGA